MDSWRNLENLEETHMGIGERATENQPVNRAEVRWGELSK